MYMPIDTFMRDKLSKLLTCCRKNHSTQHCLMFMLEMWKNTSDKGYVSAIFMDLSKAFDTLNHNLFIAKLGAYGFERDSLSFMKSYLNDRQQLITILVLGKKSLQEFHKVQYFYLTFLSMILSSLSQVLI